MTSVPGIFLKTIPGPLGEVESRLCRIQQKALLHLPFKNLVPGGFPPPKVMGRRDDATGHRECGGPEIGESSQASGPGS